MATVVSGRLPDELADWAQSYAAKRGVKRSLILEAAVGHFRDLCQTGVPDLPEPRQEGRPKAAVASDEVEVVRRFAGGSRELADGRIVGPTKEEYAETLRVRDDLRAQALRLSAERRAARGR